MVGSGRFRSRQGHTPTTHTRVQNPFFVPVIVKDTGINKTVALRPVKLHVFFSSENGQTRPSSCAKDSVSAAFFDGLHDRDARFPLSHRY